MMCATAGIADCTTGPAPDMFELGAHVKVLGQGTMYAQRAQRLYDLYKLYEGGPEVPEADRRKVEKTILRRSYEDVWQGTRAYWAGAGPPPRCSRPIPTSATRWRSPSAGTSA